MTSDEIQARMRGRLADVIAELRAKANGRAPVAREAGYRIRNADGSGEGPAVVRIYDEIWFLGVNAVDLAADLDQITAPEIRVEINSPGGDVWDGVAIFNALRSHPAKVTTRVDGIAASIASVIAQAGDHRIMLGGSQMMIHNASGLTIGDHSDHEEMAALLAHQDGIIAGIYAARSGGDRDAFATMMEAETWLTAEAAVDAGLADEVIKPPVQDRMTLQQQLMVLASSTALDDVERLVADHGDALTGRKREALVALRSRLDGILTPQAAGGPSVALLAAAAAQRRRRP